jgi:predicted AAA+ superfamily ATPase
MAGRVTAEILAEWNPWWRGNADFSLIERELSRDILKWTDRKEIIGILGVRRCGKTSLMSIIISRLLRDTRKENILFIKCDDDRVGKGDLITAAMELYKETLNPKGRTFVFIDEVQEVEGWENTLKRIYDIEKGVKLFVSGSNSSVIREDLSYKLAGRIAYFELYPFSFKEFLGTRMDAKDRPSILSDKQEIKHNLLDYAEFGGFPEVSIETDQEKRRQLLRFYYDTIVYRDIIKRREIRSPAKMENMINLFLQNIANPASYANVGGNVGLSTDSVVEYVKHLQNAYFIFSLPSFSFSVKKQEIGPKKIYCIDTGIRNIKGFRFSDDYGRLAENMVFIELMRRNGTNPLSGIFSWRDARGRELDFLVKDGVRPRELIQVCWNMEDKKTREREVGALAEAMKEFKLKEGLIITENEEGVEKAEAGTIRIVPLWKWLLA